LKKLRINNTFIKLPFIIPSHNDEREFRGEVENHEL